MTDGTVSQSAQPGTEQPQPASASAKKARQKSVPAKAPDKKPSRSDSKQARMIAMLKRESGATIEQLAKALDWQAHSIRGAISGLLKKKLGLKVVSKKNAAGVLNYRIR